MNLLSFFPWISRNCVSFFHELSVDKSIVHAYGTLHSIVSISLIAESFVMLCYQNSHCGRLTIFVIVVVVEFVYSVNMQYLNL